MVKQIVTGIVAHVDAGKTTFSEALLYQSGSRRKLGRVDKGNTFLDPNQLEKKRGITIFSHEAQFQFNDLAVTLLDTPGHIDFAAQTEAVLQVLDYAILVVSATDGIEGSTTILWQLLNHYHIPTFIFINKVDSPEAAPQKTLQQLQKELSPACLPFDIDLNSQVIEAIAMQDDQVLTDYLDSGKLPADTVRKLIRQRKIFPCFFGSALKVTGIDTFLTGFAKWTMEAPVTSDFSARVFKISHDQQGNRLTWLRTYGKPLHAKATLAGEKIDQLRNYNGHQFTTQQVIAPGRVCAATGLTNTYPGQQIGPHRQSWRPQIQPVLTYAVDCGTNDPHTCLTALQQLADEDPQLHVSWSEHLQEIHVSLMGDVQREILQQLLAERFGLVLTFKQGSILYKETISKPIEGVGHFEPLRHYAEVHLLLTPKKPGSGLTFINHCRTDILSHNWQEQVMTSLSAKEHKGVLIGAPLTDVEITLVGGKGSIVHSVGGDFREATWRAVRQGLMELRQRQQCQLLEPWYHYRLNLPNDQVGHAISDIQRMAGTFSINEASTGSLTTITGTAPVAEMLDYTTTVRNYTHGQGQLKCVVAGYQPCHNAAEVIASHPYDPVADLANTPDSVFCAHGAGYPVPWDQVPQMAHFPYQK